MTRAEAASQQHDPSTARQEHPHSFRPDVQGLRAIAVGIVVIYHLYPDVFAGGFVGVDVFFVISGFLITRHLASGLRRTGRVRLLNFWGRRARRLLPAAAVVLTVTWLASRVLLATSRLPAAADQIRASALYYQNWLLAHDAVDYLTSADAPSPVQHFWSLSVEEQFYLGWPFVFVVAALVARRNRAARGLVAFALAAAVVLGSLWYSSYLTGKDAASAYFVTTTRVWELAFGGALALLAPGVRDLLARQAWLAWVGLASVVASVFVIDGSSPFPGTVALLPVVGAGLLIVSGGSAARRGPWRLTSCRPMVFVGDISYSLYLWHWPMIVLWKSYSGGDIGVLDGPALVIAAVLLSWLTKVQVEDRVRLAAPIARSTGLSLATALVVLVPVALVTVGYSAPGRPHAKLTSLHPGAAVLAHDAEQPRKADPVPPVAQAALDFDPFNSCETPILSVAPRPCFYGDRSNPKLTVMLVGDSVANQYRSILADMARSQHWLVISELHGQCPWTATVLTRSSAGAPYTQCHEWGKKVLDKALTDYHPDVVITSDRPVLGLPDHPKPDAVSFGATADGMVTYWRDLMRHGTKVVALRETPEPQIGDIPDCLSRPNVTADSCTAKTADAIIQNTPMLQASRTAGVELLDFNSLVCNRTTCPPIVGNVVVYRDTHHLTQTYLRSMEPYVTRALLHSEAVRTGRWRS